MTPTTRSRRPSWSILVLTALAVFVASGCGSDLSREELSAANGALQVEATRAGGGGGSGGGASTGAGSSGSDVGAGVGSAGPAAPGASAVDGGDDATAAGGVVMPGAGGAVAGAAEPKGEIVLGSFGTAAGVLGQVSGPAPPAIRAWVELVNSRGGLAGHPVRLIIEDVGGDPARAQSTVRRMVEEDGVDAIFYDFAFSEKPAVLEYLEAQGVPIIGSIGGDPSGDFSPIDFNPLTSPSIGISWAYILAPRTFDGGRNYGVFYCREAATCTAQYEDLNELLPYDGTDIVYQAQVGLAQPNYTAEILGAQNAGADNLVLLIDSASVNRVSQSLRCCPGYEPMLSGTYNLNQDLILEFADELEGLVLAGRVPPWDTSPLLRDYRDAMAAFQPGQPMGDLGAGAFVVGALLEKLAAQLPDDPAPQDFIAALYTVDNETLGGRLPGITFREGSHINVNLCHIPIQLRGGEFVTGGDGGYVCAPGWQPGVG